jgi:hypothetical protein
LKWVIYIIVFLTVLIFGCESPQDMNRPGDKLDGYIFFVDSNFAAGGGFYSVSVYSADSINPLARVPIRTDSLNNIYKYGFGYEVQYSMDDIPGGRILIASTWSRYPRIPNEIPMILGTYGCDTSSTCTTHVPVLYPNTQGNFRNIWSWADTTKRLN